jgi:Dolichyl-phosphate-mannose-protein mannosyltransferase
MSVKFRSILAHDNVLLLLILLVAGTLRFWNYPHLPYMADELSALSRTQYPNLHDLILYGVEINDTHPAGVQVFIYYWIKAFGNSEMAVKLPFILFGLFSIIIAYKIAKQWFNSSVGLIVAAFMASMQYMVMFSQIARPYISGMFFCLLMVWCWSNYFFNENEKQKIKWLIGYVLFSALCAYNHHFSLLFATIVGITGLFFTDKNNWKGYVLSGILIFVLYIPHLSIFFFQFSKGGLGGPDGWLGKPEYNWIFNYIKYLFHFSFWMYFLVFMLFIFSIFFQAKQLQSTKKYRIIALGWFFSLFCIEYFYSFFVNPIIQFSTLIFVFPFLLIFVFSYFGELSNALKTVVVMAILIIGTSTLVFSRKHFQTFYKQPFEEQIKNTYKNLDRIKNDKNVTIVLLEPPFHSQYYFKKYNRHFNFIFHNSYNVKSNPKAFRNFVRNQTTDYFITGNLPEYYIQIIKEKYPFLIDKQECFTNSSYCFSKLKNQFQQHQLDVFDKKIEFDFKMPDMDSTMEFSKTYSLKLKDVTSDRHCIITISARISIPDKTSNPVLVMSLKEGGKALDWFGSDYKKYESKTEMFSTVILSQDLTSFDFKGHPNAEAEIYIWNPDKKKVLMDDFKISITEGNHLLYSLYEPID